MERYANWFRDHRLALTLVAAALSSVAALGVARLRFDDVPRAIFASDDAGYRRLLDIQEEFGADDNDVLVVMDGRDWTTAEGLAVLAEAARRAAELEEVVDVLWAGAVPLFDGVGGAENLMDLAAEDPARAENLARSNPLLRGRWLSEDGRTALLVLRLPPDATSIGALEPPIRSITALVHQIDLELPGRARVTGVPPIRVELYRLIRRDQVRFFLIAGVLCSLTALAMFRSVGALVATTLPPLVGGLWAFGAIGFLGVKIDLLSGVLSMVVVVIALTDSVHLMIDVRHSRADGLGPVESATQAIRHLGIPCLLTTLTTAIGFGSLGLADVPAIRHFGLLAAGAVSIAFLAVLSVLPLLVSVLPSVGEGRSDPASSRWGRWAPPFVRWVLRHARGVAVAGVISAVLCGWLSLGLVPENRLTEALPRGESYRALMDAQDAFGGVLPSYVIVEWDPGAQLGLEELLPVLGAVEEVLGRERRLAPPLSIRTLLAAVPAGLTIPGAILPLLPKDVTKRLLRLDLGKALVAAGSPDAGREVIEPLYERVESGLAAVRRAHPDFELHITGTDYVARTNINRMIDELARSLAFAAVLLFGLIAFEFRSPRIGLVSLLPNLFPLVLVGAVLRLSGYPLQMASAVLFTVLLGLAVDDTIHFLARLRRERRSAVERGEDPDAERVLEETFLTVGRGIIATTSVLLVGFGVVGWSPLPTNRTFAALSCLGLAAALLGDLVLLPAILAVRVRSRGSRRERG
ncbi:MAG TPA: hypothetical protein ENJ09_12455 [Planctomycetes bacterium]|nr:hypothetical protein [Planctomycetota bacterium]